VSAARLRPARPGEEDALSRLCLKSKAYWGYDAAFMAAVSPYLKVTSEAIAAGYTTVAEREDGSLLGVCQIDPDSEIGTLDLLFVSPDAIGTGAGSRVRPLRETSAHQSSASPAPTRHRPPPRRFDFPVCLIKLPAR